MATDAASARRIALALLPVLLTAIGWQYRTTFLSIVDKWQTDAAFSHGLLIVPISAWLAWRKRDELATVPLSPSWWGALAMLGCVAAWVIARGTGVLVVEQFAAVAMVPAAVLAVWGARAAAVMAFPLAFLLFAVPFGRGLVPALMQVTADIGTWALRLSGVPVYRSHMYITIPAGEFEVARACSGLNYFVTGLVLGVLYAYLTYATWRKRLLCVLAFIVVPIIANGLRVYFTILVSHLTDMRYGPGAEHVTFGRIFFVLVMLAMFLVGRRWRDEAAAPAALPTEAPRPGPPGAGHWLAVAVVLALGFAGPAYLDELGSAARAAASDVDAVVSLPPGAGEWRGPSLEPGAWRPGYEGALSERLAVYRTDDGQRVDVYVGVYGIGSTTGAEMIRSQNRVFPTEGSSLAPSETVHLSLPGSSGFAVRQVEGRTGAFNRTVWHWFVVGDRALVSPYAVKAREASALLTRATATERVVMLSTTADAGAQSRLEAFVAAHATCVAGGFATEACTP